MSNNAVLSALRRMGYANDEMSGRGFRAMARTVLDEVLHFRPDYIEHQLAHAVKDPNGRAYNRTARPYLRGGSYSLGYPQSRKAFPGTSAHPDSVLNAADPGD